MTEDEFRAVVEAEVAAYLAQLQTGGAPYPADPGLWQTHAAAIAAAAVAVYYAQGAPLPTTFGPNEAATLATQIATSELVAGAPAYIDAKIGAALAAGGATAAATLVAAAVTAIATSALAVVTTSIATNVYLWAAAVAGLAAAVAAGNTHQTWKARNDDKTRPDHRAADGQTVPIGALFTVGGWAMRYPHDPLAPAEETANCRCKVRYSRRPT